MWGSQISVILDECKHNYEFKGKLFKGSKMRVYKKAIKIPATLISDVNIIKAQETLLRLVQVDINLAKEHFYREKAKSLQYKITLT